MKLYSDDASLTNELIQWPEHATSNDYPLKNFGEWLVETGTNATRSQLESELLKNPHTTTNALVPGINLQGSVAKPLEDARKSGDRKLAQLLKQGSEVVSSAEWHGSTYRHSADGLSFISVSHNTDRTSSSSWSGRSLSNDLKRTGNWLKTETKGLLGRISQGAKDQLTVLDVRKQVRDRLQEVNFPEKISSIVPKDGFLSAGGRLKGLLSKLRPSRLTSKLRDSVANIVGKHGNNFLKGSAPSIIDFGLYANKMRSIYQKQERGKISQRKMRIKMGRATGGLIGGLLGGGVGLALTGGNPVGAIGGSIVGDMLGRPAGALVAKKFLSSSPKPASNTETSQPSANSVNSEITDMKRGMNSAHSITVQTTESADVASTSTGSSGELPIEPLKPIDTSATSDTDTSTPNNLAKENQRARSGPQIVNQEVRVDPSSIADVDRKVEEAKQEAIQEMERRFGTSPTPF